MLELHHIINSVCAQKVRMALYEKGAEGQEGIAGFLAKRRPSFLNLETGK